MDLHIFGNSSQTEVNLDQVWDTVIIGGGPAGYNAALYTYRKGFKPLMILGDRGGQVSLTNEIENYLGYKEISGGDLVEKFHEHVADFKIDILEGNYVEKIEREGKLFKISLSTLETVTAKTVIIATGGEHRKLNVDGEERLNSRGLSYCAICDAPFFKERRVVVVGGGDSAVEAAIDLSKWATHVHIVHRSTFRAEKILMDRMLALDNVSYELGSVVTKIGGENVVEYLEIENKEKGTHVKMEVDGLFVEIGQDPRSELVKDLVELNDSQEIVVDRVQMTNVPGLFAAGDVTNSPYKQIITSAAEGAVAALSASNYLTKWEED